MSSTSEGKWKLVTIVAVAVVVVGVVLFVVVRGCGEPEGSEDVTEEAAPGYRRGSEEVQPVPEGASERSSAPAKGLKVVLGGPLRQASGPMRFVARYGETRRRPDATPRTEDEARELAESVRQRFLDGEDPVPIIRDLSDPPVGIPEEVLGQGDAVGPGEASPVLRLRDGFVVFYRPTASEEP